MIRVSLYIDALCLVSHIGAHNMSFPEIRSVTAMLADSDRVLREDRATERQAFKESTTSKVINARKCRDRLEALILEGGLTDGEGET